MTASASQRDRRHPHVVAPTAAFYAMPRVSLPPGVTDEDYVLGTAARDRRPLRLRIRLRHQTRGRVLPRRLPGEPVRALRRSTTSSRDFTRDFLSRAV